MKYYTVFLPYANKESISSFAAQYKKLSFSSAILWSTKKFQDGFRLVTNLNIYF